MYIYIFYFYNGTVYWFVYCLENIVILNYSFFFFVTRVQGFCRTRDDTPNFCLGLCNFQHQRNTQNNNERKGCFASVPDSRFMCVKHLNWNMCTGKSCIIIYVFQLFQIIQYASTNMLNTLSTTCWPLRFFQLNIYTTIPWKSCLNIFPFTRFSHLKQHVT